MPKIHSLDELLRAINGIPMRGVDEEEASYSARCRRYAAATGLKMDGSGYEIDWGNMPTFGGTQPREASALWSWDETREIRGDTPDVAEILHRSVFDPRFEPE